MQCKQSNKCETNVILAKPSINGVLNYMDTNDLCTLMQCPMGNDNWIFIGYPAMVFMTVVFHLLAQTQEQSTNSSMLRSPYRQVPDMSIATDVTYSGCKVAP
jgi:hypothetical protein